jgi:SAM-dependent methyltransferase
MIIQKDIYNNSYSHFTPDYIEFKNISKINKYLDENSESLKDFIVKYFDQFKYNYDMQQLSVLELGCGVGSFSYFLKENFIFHTGLDFSEVAIMAGRSISRLKENELDLKVMDVTSGDAKLDLSYDCIVDSHLLHCLTDSFSRKSYFDFVKRHLNPDGQLLIECMAFHPKLQTPVGYSFDENYVLSKEFGEKNVPIRSIQQSREIEKELSDNGFKINYLYFHNELSFNVFEDYTNYPVEFLPKTIRLSASKI